MVTAEKTSAQPRLLCSLQPRTLSPQRGLERREGRVARAPLRTGTGSAFCIFSPEPARLRSGVQKSGARSWQGNSAEPRNNGMCVKSASKQRIATNLELQLTPICAPSAPAGLCTTQFDVPTPSTANPRRKMPITTMRRSSPGAVMNIGRCIGSMWMKCSLPIQYPFNAPWLAGGHHRGQEERGATA